MKPERLKSLMSEMIDDLVSAHAGESQDTAVLVVDSSVPNWLEIAELFGAPISEVPANPEPNTHFLIGLADKHQFVTVLGALSQDTEVTAIVRKALTKEPASQHHFYTVLLSDSGLSVVEVDSRKATTLKSRASDTVQAPAWDMSLPKLYAKSDASN